MKKKRMTLEEIKNQFLFLEKGLTELGDKEFESIQINIDTLRNQIRQLEDRLIQLKTKATNLDLNKEAQLSKQIMYQSITVIQALMVFLSDIELMV